MSQGRFVELPRHGCEGQATRASTGRRWRRRATRTSGRSRGLHLYIQSRPKVIGTTRVEPEGEHAIRAFVHSDWPGCRDRRKSISGGVLTAGGMAVNMWSATQSSAATSSSEAEQNSLSHGPAEALGLASAMGWEVKVRV